MTSVLLDLQTCLNTALISHEEYLSERNKSLHDYLGKDDELKRAYESGLISNDELARFSSSTRGEN